MCTDRKKHLSLYSIKCALSPLTVFLSTATICPGFCSQIQGNEKQVVEKVERKTWFFRIYSLDVPAYIIFQCDISSNILTTYTAQKCATTICYTNYYFIHTFFFMLFCVIWCCIGFSSDLFMCASVQLCINSEALFMPVWKYYAYVINSVSSVFKGPHTYCIQIRTFCHDRE